MGRICDTANTKEDDTISIIVITVVNFDIAKVYCVFLMNVALRPSYSLWTLSDL